MNAPMKIAPFGREIALRSSAEKNSVNDDNDNNNHLRISESISYGRFFPSNFPWETVVQILRAVLYVN